MRMVYICHPYLSDPEGNIALVREICRRIIDARLEIIPLAPHLYLPQFISEASDRALAMLMCIDMAKRCDEVWVYGRAVTAGMADEIEAASVVGKRVRFVPAGEVVP